VVVDLGVGLNHGNGSGKQMTTTAVWRDGGYKRLSYCYRDKTVELSGPLTAFRVLQKLALAVRHEVARNYLMSRMLSNYGSEDYDDEGYDSSEEQAPSKLPVFPPEQRVKYTDRHIAPGTAAVLNVEPDPTQAMSQRALQKLDSQWENMGSGGGVTTFEGFKKHGSEPDV
jgi:hypothetical protein